MKRFLTLAVFAAASVGSCFAIADIKVGDKVTVDGVEYLVGMNLITNPSFSTVDASGNITGWTVGTYANMTTSNFTWNKTGGTDGGPYIKGKGNTGAGGVNSIATRWAIQPNKKYYLSFWVTGVTKTSQYIVGSITNKESTAGGQNEGGDNGKIIVGTPGSSTASADAVSVVVPSVATDWAQTNLFFDSGDYTYLQFNARWLGTAWGFDNFYLSELYDTATTTAADLKRIQLSALVENTTQNEEANYAEYPAIMGEVDDAVLEAGDVAGNTSATADEVQAAIDKLNAVIAAADQGKNDAVALGKLVTKCQNLMNTTAYPGASAFSTAVDAAVEAQDVSKSTSADYAAALTALQTALKTYRFSQVASKEAPANYTFMIQHPWFCNDDSIPTSNSLDDIAAAKLTGTMLESAGWVKGSSYTGGDQRLNYTQNRTCWNAWATNFTGYLDVHQTLTDLPSGLYSITCDAITQDGCLNDQHAYATASTGTVNSPVMTIEGWNAADATAGIWEELKTVTNGYVLVNDGKLTIGMQGTHDATKTSGTASDGRNGWFCCTNYKLQYYGPATGDELLKAFQDKVAACQAQCDTMLFKGDKATYQAVLTAYGSATTEDAIKAALDTINKAQSAAGTSIYHQGEVLYGSYQAIKDSIAANVYDATLTPAMQAAVDAAKVLMEADGQTAAAVRDTIINSLRAYRYTYADEYAKAQKAIAGYTQQTSKDFIGKIIAAQIEVLKSGLIGPKQITAMVAELEKALALTATNELMNNGGTDYTSLINNPTCEGTGTKVNPVGWNISLVNSGNSQPNNLGQQYDGDTKGYYLDAWNGTPKSVLFTACQTITNLPNGTYELKAMSRNDGKVGTEGAYLFTLADNDSTTSQFAMVKRVQTDVTTYKPDVKSYLGTDSVVWAADSYGEIWEAAAKATNAGTSGSTLDMAIYGANSSQGRGWKYVSVPAVVKNHVLTIGFTNDSTFTGKYKDVDGNACLPFSGTWLSADNFTLTLKAMGDNSGWSPITAISTANADSGLQVEVTNRRIITNRKANVFNMSGQMVNASGTVAPGVYIVVSGKQAVKVAVK
jgi:hypothetical protein